LIDLAELYLYKEKYKKELSSDNYASNAANALEQACHLQSEDPNLYFSLGRAYFWLGELEDAKRVFEFGVRMAPQDSRFSAYLGYAQSKSSNEDKDILESWERVVLYGPGACSEALDILEEACKNLKCIDSYQSMRVNYASFLAKLNEDEKKGETIMHCLREMIEYRAKNKNGEEWKYAIALIKLLDLCNDLEAWDCKQVEKENLFDEYILKIIAKLRALKGKKSGYEEAYNRYALGYLLFLYYIYKKDLYEDAEKVSIAEKDKFEMEYRAIKNEAEANLAFAEVLLKSKLDELNTRIKCSLPGYNAYLQDYCQILVDSGLLYLKYGEYKQAERHFEYAIETLNERPEEIKRRGLYSLLAKSLRLQNKSKSRALKLAQRARILNPLGYEERKELGKIFCDLDEFDYGLEELDNAHSWKPDNPEILFEMGKYHLKRALICNDRNLRKKTLNNAMDNIKQALKILEKSQVEKRGLVRYWLGRVYSELNENKKAIPHFRILFNVRFDKQNTDDVWLIAALQLGCALFKIKSYNEADSIFGQIIKRLGSADNSSVDIFDADCDPLMNEKIKYIKKNNANTICNIVGERLDDRFSLCEIFVRACLGKSFSCIERNGDLSEALHYAKLAGDHIRLCKTLISENQCEEDREVLHDGLCRCQASYEDCRGWILFNLGQVDKAKVYLEKSVSRWSDSLAYTHLALAYESKMESWDPTAGDKTLPARKTLECYRLAIDLDIRDEYADDLIGLRQKLARKNIDTSAKEEKKDGLPESIGSNEKCSQG
jgi:tetratricopeptide (TPR) repeat protein